MTASDGCHEDYHALGVHAPRTQTEPPALPRWVRVLMWAVGISAVVISTIGQFHG